MVARNNIKDVRRGKRPQLDFARVHIFHNFFVKLRLLFRGEGEGAEEDETGTGLAEALEDEGGRSRVQPV